MRTIKFRAWDGKKYHKVCRLGLNGFSTDLWSPSPVSCEVRRTDDLVIEQFTGLHDKRGVKIYEGDIVRILYTDWVSKPNDDSRTIEEYMNDIASIGYVEWDSLLTGFYIVLDTGYGDINAGRHGFIEVIGNVHENPELLEGDSQP